MTKTPFLLACVICIFACAGPSTRFEQVWREPSADRESVQRVVTLYESQDGALRRTIEDDLARKLQRQGVHAVPAYTLLEPRDLEDHQRMRMTLTGRGYDGILTVRLVGGETYPLDTISGPWGAGRPAGYEDYVLSSPVVHFETTLYSLRDDQLLWSARSKTVDASSTNQVIDEVTSLVATTMQRHGVAVATARR